MQKRWNAHAHVCTHTCTHIHTHTQRKTWNTDFITQLTVPIL